MIDIGGGPGTSGMGQAIAMEAEQLDREIARANQQRQLMQASNDRTTAVPERLRAAVRAAKDRLAKAETAYTLADQQARLRIRQQSPSEALQKLWYEEMTISQGREREQAKEQLAAAELDLGRQVEARRALEALEASAPARKADAERIYLQTLDQIDREIIVARSRCAT
jgi:hypothetical protein